MIMMLMMTDLCRRCYRRPIWVVGWASALRCSWQEVARCFYLKCSRRWRRVTPPSSTERSTFDVVDDPSTSLSWKLSPSTRTPPETSSWTQGSVFASRSTSTGVRTPAAGATAASRSASPPKLDSLPSLIRRQSDCSPASDLSPLPASVRSDSPWPPGSASSSPELHFRRLQTGPRSFRDSHRCSPFVVLSPFAPPRRAPCSPPCWSPSRLAEPSATCALGRPWPGSSCDGSRAFASDWRAGSRSGSLPRRSTSSCADETWDWLLELYPWQLSLPLVDINQYKIGLLLCCRYIRSYANLPNLLFSSTPEKNTRAELSVECSFKMYVFAKPFIACPEQANSSSLQKFWMQFSSIDVQYATECFYNRLLFVVISFSSSFISVHLSASTRNSFVMATIQATVEYTVCMRLKCVFDDFMHVIDNSHRFLADDTLLSWQPPQQLHL